VSRWPCRRRDHAQTPAVDFAIAALLPEPWALVKAKQEEADGMIRAASYIAGRVDEASGTPFDPEFMGWLDENRPDLAEGVRGLNVSNG
jgi:hypothetical protein